MLIGIISDTHENIESLKHAITYFNAKKTELVIHCGDWTSCATIRSCKDLNCPVVSVFGNCDFNHQHMKKEAEKHNITFHEEIGFILLGDHTAGIYHGHEPKKLKEMIESKEYDIIFTGHTHCPSIYEIKKTMIINPGSLKAYAPQSIALYDSKTNKAKIIHLNDI